VSTPSSVNASVPSGGLKKTPATKTDLSGLSKDEIMKMLKNGQFSG
jgi:hypothetical protein